MVVAFAIGTALHFALGILFGHLAKRDTQAQVNRVSRQATNQIVTRLREHRSFRMSKGR